jgi:phosphoglycerate kinase
MNKQTVKDLKLKNKKVLIRCDFKVPLKNGGVADDSRIRAALPTIQYLIDQQARLVLCSHLGRPKGRVQAEQSLRPVADHLSALLKVKVEFLDDCIGDKIKGAVAALTPGGVLLLENTRFHKGEKANDPNFARELARGFESFINDAFATAHRAHASTEGVAHHLPAAAGLLMQREVERLTLLKENPPSPMAALFGGAKLSDKVDTIEALLDKSEVLLIGGGMANLFFKASGREIGDSFIETDGLETASRIIDKAGDRLVLPEDVIVARDIHEDADHKTVPADEVSPGWRIVDIGPKSINRFAQTLKGMKSIIWNGPVGVFETRPFGRGTVAVARQIAQIDAQTIIGGGDTGAAVNQANVTDKITHISTGGGAFLALLADKSLPALAILNDR